MADVAKSYKGARALKIKLTGEDADKDRLLAIREARPDVWLGVDANQGFSRETLERLLPTMIETGIQLIEQPFRTGEDALLDGFQSPIPIAADESVQSSEDIPRCTGRFDVINIKLDKCGGLTEGLAMVRLARECGLETMVGNMMGLFLEWRPLLSSDSSVQL